MSGEDPLARASGHPPQDGDPVIDGEGPLADVIDRAFDYRGEIGRAHV